MRAAVRSVLFSAIQGIDLDFVRGRYASNSGYRGDFLGLPGATYARAGAATAETAAGAIINFAADVPRITDRGVLIEEARTNLLLNSATLSTQNVTVTAAAHTLSFYGTGTVTLTGASTAGPLVGTGAGNRVTLTFTPTAGTLTLTVSGSVTSANLEAGAFATSYIPTTGAAATRARDRLHVSTPPGLTYPLSLSAEFFLPVDSATFRTLVQVNINGSDSNRSYLRMNTIRRVQSLMVAAGSEVAAVASPPTAGVGVITDVAGRFELNNVNGAMSGEAGTADTSAALPATPTVLRVGGSDATGAEPNGYIRRASVYPRAFSDAELQALTA